MGHMGVSKNRGGPPKSSILIGCSIIFTFHFGGFPPIFGSTPYFGNSKELADELAAEMFERWDLDAQVRCAFPVVGCWKTSG